MQNLIGPTKIGLFFVAQNVNTSLENVPVHVVVQHAVLHCQQHINSIE